MKKVINFILLSLILCLLSFNTYDIQAYTITESDEDYLISIDKEIEYVSLGLRNSIVKDKADNYYIFGEVNTYMGSGSKDYTPDLLESDYLNLDQNETILVSDLNEFHSAILTSNHRLLMSGSNSHGQIGNDTFINQSTYVCIDSYFNFNVDEYIIDFALGDYFTIALSNQGNVFAWGDNEAYQLGDNTLNHQKTPYDITNKFILNTDEYVTKVSATYKTSYAITNQGRVFSWGSNYYGELGSGIDIYDCIATPTDITANFNLNQDELVIDIYSGYRNAYVITSEERIFSWGNNAGYALGVEGISYSKLPIDITSNFPMLASTNIEKFFVSENTVHIIFENKDVYGFGSNIDGRIGNLATTSSSLPIKINSSFNLESDEFIEEITSSYRGASVITNKGRIFVWGGDGLYLGITTDIAVLEPTNILSYDEYIVEKLDHNLSSEITHISTSNKATAVVNSDNEIYVWGNNADRFLQITSYYKLSKPYLFDSRIDFFENETISDIELGNNFGSILTTNNRVFMWGSNQSGQLGNYSTNTSNYPIEITDFFDLETDEVIVDVELGHDNAIALSNLGNVFVWGDNSYFQLGFFTSSRIKKPVKITNLFNLEVDEFITKIVTGRTMTYALSNQGRVFKWGSLTSVDLKQFEPYMIQEIEYGTIPSVEKIIDIETSGYHTIILTNWNHLYALGLNGNGQLGTGDYISSDMPVHVTLNFDLQYSEDFEEIYTGLYSTAIKTSKGRLFYFGSVNKTQLGLDSSIDTSSPIDVTDCFLTYENETISNISISDDHAALSTSLDRLLLWGDDEYSQLGFPEDPYNPLETLYEPSLNLDEIQSLQTTYIEKETNYLVSNFELGLVFTYELEDMISSATVNNTIYTDFIYEDGLVKVIIPNQGSLLDTINFTVNSVTYWNGITYIPMENNTGSTTLVVDDTPPVIEPLYNEKLIIEEGIGDSSYLVASISDDSLEEITYTTSGFVDWNLNGTYYITYEATDSSGNVGNYIQEIEVIDPITISNYLIGDYTINNAEDIIYDETIDLTNTFITKDLTDYDSVEDYSNYQFNQSSNDLVYTFNVDNEVIIISKNVIYNDDTFPTFEVNALIVQAGIYKDIDWTTKVENINDEDLNHLVIEEVSDNVNYEVPGIYEIIISVTDAFNHTTLNTYDVHVVDTLSPKINFIPDQTIEAGSSSNIDWSILITDIFDYGSDTFTVEEVNDFVDYDHVGNYYAHVKVTDEFGNATVDTIYINVVDTTAPTYLYFSFDYEVEVGMVVSDWRDRISDITENSDSEVTIDILSNDVDMETPGDYTIIFVLSDENGNSAEHTRLIRVYPAEAPIITVSDAEFEAGSLDEYRYWTNFISDIEDNLSTGSKLNSASVEDNVDFSRTGEYYAIVSVTDEAGNTGYATINVIIYDHTAPVINNILPQEIEVNEYTDIDWSSYIYYIENSLDEVTITETIDNVTYTETGTYTVDVLLTDKSGNSSTGTLTVNVVDATAPEFTVVDQYIEVGTSPSTIIWNDFIYDLTDNYDENPGVIITYYEDVNFYKVGTYRVYVKGYDDYYNYNYQQFDVHVVDTTIPTYDFYTDFNLEVTDNTSFDFSDRIVNAQDNSGEEVNIYQLSCNVDGNTPGTYTATIVIEDKYGNQAFQEIIINILDVDEPTFDFIPYMTIEVDKYEDIDWTTYIQNIQEDSDGEVFLREVSDDVLYDTLGEYYVVVEAADESGNTYQQYILITVADQTAPTITLIGDSSYTIEAGTIYQDLGATCTDNYDEVCSVEMAAYTVNPYVPGEYYVGYTAKDSSGNIAYLYRTVIVVDTTKPYFEVDDLTIQLGRDEIDWINYIGLVEENSDEDVIKEVLSNNLDYNHAGQYEVVVKVTDSSGNFLTETITVTVIDTIAPAFDLPDEVRFEVYSQEEIDWYSYISNIIEASNNGEVTITITGIENLNFENLSSSSIRYNVEDINGNINTKYLRVYVLDTQSPTFDVIESQVFELGDYSSFDWTTLVTNIQDNYCDEFVLNVITNQVDFNQVGSYLVEVEVSDMYNNRSTQEFTVDIIDTTKPTVSLLPNIDTIYVGEEYTDVGVDYVDYSAVTIETENLVDPLNEGVYVITYTATDASGNITIRTRYVTVINKEPILTFILNDAVTTLKVNQAFIDTGCNVLINNETYECQVKENTVNETLEGIYYIVYSYTYNDIEYEYYRFIFVIDGTYLSEDYYIFKKEDEEGDLS